MKKKNKLDTIIIINHRKNGSRALQIIRLITLDFKGVTRLRLRELNPLSQVKVKKKDKQF